MTHYIHAPHKRKSYCIFPEWKKTLKRALAYKKNVFNLIENKGLSESEKIKKYEERMRVKYGLHWTQWAYPKENC
jgi:hypothetical protein